MLLEDCGMTHLTDDYIREKALARDPADESRINAIDYGCFTSDDFEETIRTDMRTLRAESYVAGMDVLGFAFITETGELKQIFA
jgi:carbonic anhydrase